MSRDGSYLSMDTLGGIEEAEEYKEEDSLLNTTDNNPSHVTTNKRSHLSVEKIENKFDSENVILQPVYILE